MDENKENVEIPTLPEIKPAEIPSVTVSPVEDAHDKAIEELHKRHLTPKQAMFVIEYLKDLNATQAAIRAGYSENTAQEIGSENLSKPIISKEIDKQMQYRAKRALITSDYILSSMQEVAERCMQAKPVMVFDYEEKCMKQEEEDGEGVWEFDSAGANKALENLARNQKLLTDKQEIGNLDGTNLQPQTVNEIFVESKEEAQKLLEKNAE